MDNLPHQEDMRKLQILNVCRKDPWEFCKYVMTIDETDKLDPIKPFPIQKTYIKLYFQILLREDRVAVPKSRRMLMSWINCVYCLWVAMFHKGKHVAVVSKKEDSADWLIQKRIKFIYENLSEEFPKDLLPVMESKYCLISFPELNSVIQGFPQGEAQLRQYTLSVIFADELAFWESAEGTYNASIPTLQGGGQFIGISSAAPGFFQKLVFDKLGDDGMISQRVTGAIVKSPINGIDMWRNSNNDFFIFKLHWSADEEKRDDPTFIKEATKGMTPKKAAQEYEIEWHTHIGQPVYSDFNSRVHGAEELLVPHLGIPLLRGWDFGLTPACVIAQWRDGELAILKEFVAVGRGIKRFAPEVMEALSLLYPAWTDQKNDFLDFVDPSGYFRKDTDEETCVTIMSGFGMKPVPGALNWSPRVESVEHYLTTMYKGKPILKINMDECPMLVTGFEGGYKYPEKVLENEPDKLRPVKNEYSHPHDGLQMITSKIKEIVKKAKVKIPENRYFKKGTKDGRRQRYSSRNR
jgi:hypothetical protein